MDQMLRHFALAVAAAGAITLIAAPAEAQGKRRVPGGYPVVYAESRYSTKAISGPVREGPRGQLQVGTPGGNWLDCGRNCSETLRRETIDFWESRGGKNDPVDGPAYLSRYFFY
jgi:hypothetical protein